MAENYREFDKSDTAHILPEIRIKSYTFRVRELILGVISVVALVTCLVLVAILAKNSAGANGDNTNGMTSAQIAVQTLCTDPPCLKAAAYAVSNMNMSVNPCDDFFQYACGNYPNENPLDPDVSQRTVFWNLYYENEDKLRTILEQPAIRSSSFSSEKKLKDFFMSCIDDYGKMNAGGKVFIEKIIQPLGGWDVLQTFNASVFNFQSALERTSIEFWTAALFTFRVVTDPYDKPNRVIELDMSGMGMYWIYYVRPTAGQIRADYKKFIRTVGLHLVRDSGLNLSAGEVANRTEVFVNDAYDIEFQLANITANTVPTEDPHSLEQRVTLSAFTSSTGNVVDFVHFFRTMFGMTNIDGNTRVILHEADWIRRVMAMVQNIPAADKARKLQNYFVWRLAQSYATELSWNYIHASRKFHVDMFGTTAFLGTNKHCFKQASEKFADVMGSLFAKDSLVDKNRDKVIVSFIVGAEYFQGIDRDHGKKWRLSSIEGVLIRKLSNYLIWRLAYQYAQELSWDYIHANRKFYDDVYGYRNFYGTWYHCFWHADHSMPDALGALFAQMHFNDKNKEKTEEIVKYVRQTLIDNLDSIKFMDDETKQKAKEKLSAATDKMGYPDIYMRDSAIDTIYEHIAINRSDYFQNLLNLNKFDQADWTRRLMMREDRSRWLFNSYDTTMYFYNSWNQLLVPAGMLQFPVYEWTLPHYYNFGAMGGLVGHYLVHSIDGWGSQYDANGQYGAWYSNRTKIGYQKTKQCYASVYGNKTMGPYKVIGSTQTITVPVRGTRFAWEGLAETSGIRAAYRAYKKWIMDKGDEKLTPTPHYTNDQSFFLTYAQLGCYTRTEALSYNYAQRQKIPEHIRINAAMSLLDEFTAAFNCPAGSPMNSPQKCDTF